MCNSTNTTTSTSSTSLPGGLTDAVNAASAGALNQYRASNPVAGMVQPIAGLNAFQNQAANTSAGIAGYQPQMVGSGYQPQQVGTGYQPQQVTAGNVTQFGSPSVSGSDIQARMNPYTSSVIGTSLDELNRQLAMTNQASAGHAASAGAFGGDRAAIVQTENARNANQIASQMIAGLNSQGYGQAAALAEQDASRQLQAGTSQAQLDANVGQGNQYAGLQAANLNSGNERANQSAGLAAASLNSTNDRANQSAGLAGAQLNLSAAGQEANIGAQFRAASQQNMDSNYSSALRDAYWPVTSLSTLTGQLGQLASAAPRTTSTTQTTPGPSYIGQAAGLGTAALGLNSLLPGGLSGAVGGIGKLLGIGGSSGTSAFDSSNLFGSDPSILGDAGFGTATGGVASGLFDGGGGLNSYDLGFARGGLAGYADGGDVTQDGTVDPATGMWVPAIPRRFTAPAPAPAPAPTGLAAAAVNPVAPNGADAPMPAGQGMTASLGLAAAAPDAGNAVDRALAVNPAAIVAGNEPTDQPAADQAASPAFGGLAGAAPALDDDIPVPPIPPTQGGLAAAGPAAPAAPTRIERSADPSAPIPTAGLAAAQPSASAPAAVDPSQNRMGMALLAAGLGMMGSKSHTALGAVGEGGLAGVQQLNTMQREQDASALRRATLANQQAYQQGMLGVRQQAAATGQQKADTGQQRVDQQGRHYDAQDAATQTRTDAYVQRALAAASKAGQPTSASLQQSAMDAFLQANPGTSAADAWSYLKGYAGRDANAAARLGLQQQKMANDQDWRAFQQQSKATDQEVSSAKSIMFNATNLGKPMTMDQALSQVRSARGSAGPAPIVGQPIQRSGGPAVGAPVQVATPADAMKLPSGTQFVTPDGRVLVRH